MSGNHVTIFSNGIADFRRSYPVSASETKEISIPVKTDDVADVLASLNVYGPVALKAPPSFRPANDDDSNLEIKPENVLRELGTRLSGSQVRLEKASGTIEGTLVGLHTEQEATGGDRVAVSYLVVLTDEGFTKMPLRELQRMQFADEDVRTEIDKALQRNFQEIKPRSTFITLSITTEDSDAEALLQYTLPAAAWKISYRLRRNEMDEAKNPFEFQGFAIVDNTTDEDWTDFWVSVVTGEPITFSTDLAESKIPHRDHVNVVKDRALGSIEVEDGIALGAMPEMDFGGAEAPVAPELRSMQKFSPRMAMGGVSNSLAPAKMDEATVQTVGDFCLFESKQPVTILANRSAVIPMFQSTLSDTQTVLHYKHENHPDRPYRSVKFKNEMEHSLGRGVCTVYEGGVYGGSCILPATPPGETCLLPHALETGVKVRQETQRGEFRTVGIQISEGICQISQYQRRPVHYQLQNLKEESFEVVLDHDFILNHPELTCERRRGDGTTTLLGLTEKLKDGQRFSFPIDAKEHVTVLVEETKVERTRFELLSDRDDQLPGKMQWLIQNVIDTNGPLSDDPALQTCLEIQKRLDEKQREVRKAEQNIVHLEKRQDRLRKNLGVGGQNEQTDRWRADLAETETRITQIEENILPALHQESHGIRTELRSALATLNADWQEPT